MKVLLIILVIFLAGCGKESEEAPKEEPANEVQVVEQSEVQTTTQPGRTGAYDGDDERIGTLISVSAEFSLKILNEKGYLIDITLDGNHNKFPLLTDNKYHLSTDCTGESYAYLQLSMPEKIIPQYVFQIRIDGEIQKNKIYHMIDTMAGAEINSVMTYNADSQYAHTIFFKEETDEYDCVTDKEKRVFTDIFPDLIKYEEISIEETGIKLAYLPPITIKED